MNPQNSNRIEKTTKGVYNPSEFTTTLEDCVSLCPNQHRSIHLYLLSPSIIFKGLIQLFTEKHQVQLYDVLMFC